MLWGTCRTNYNQKETAEKFRGMKHHIHCHRSTWRWLSSVSLGCMLHLTPLPPFAAFWLLSCCQLLAVFSRNHLCIRVTVLEVLGSLGPLSPILYTNSSLPYKLQWWPVANPGWHEYKTQTSLHRDKTNSEMWLKIQIALRNQTESEAIPKTTLLIGSFSCLASLFLWTLLLCRWLLLEFLTKCLQQKQSPILKCHSDISGYSIKYTSSRVWRCLSLFMSWNVGNLIPKSAVLSGRILGESVHS